MFLLGDTVHWVSQAAGFAKVKVGVVEAVIPPNTALTPEQKKQVGGSPGSQRKVESYLIRVSNGKSSGKLYWPNQNLLNAGPADELPSDKSLDPAQILSIHLNKVIRQKDANDHHFNRGVKSSKPIQFSPGQLEKILDDAGLRISKK